MDHHQELYELNQQNEEAEYHQWELEQQEQEEKTTVFDENDFEENEYEDLCTNKDWTNEDDERYHQWVLEQQEEEEQMLNDSLYDEEKERRAGITQAIQSYWENRRSE